MNCSIVGRLSVKACTGLIDNIIVYLMEFDKTSCAQNSARDVEGVRILWCLRCHSLFVHKETITIFKEIYHYVKKLKLFILIFFFV